MHDGPGALGHGRQQHVEHLLLLGHVRALEHRPGHDLLAAEVAGRGQVGLAEGALELGHVRAELLPGAVGQEVPRDQVLEGLAHRAPVGGVAVVVRLAADAAAQARLAHHFQRGLVGDHRALLGAKAHGDLPLAAAVGGAREHLPGLVPQLRPGRRGRVGERVAVRRAREPRRGQQVGEGEPPREGLDRLGLLPVGRSYIPLRARNFLGRRPRPRVTVFLQRIPLPDDLALVPLEFEVGASVGLVWLHRRRPAPRAFREFVDEVEELYRGTMG